MQESYQNPNEFIFQNVKYYASIDWIRDDGVMKKHIFNNEYEFIGMLQWDVNGEYHDKPIGSWTQEDNVVVVLFESANKSANIYYWYVCQTELLICMTFDVHSFNEIEIDELKEFQSFVNGVDKSYTQPRKSGNYLHYHIKEYHLLKDPREIELYHNLGTFPYEGGIYHVYNPMKRIPTLEIEFVARLK